MPPALPGPPSCVPDRLRTGLAFGAGGRRGLGARPLGRYPSEPACNLAAKGKGLGTGMNGQAQTACACGRTLNGLSGRLQAKGAPLLRRFGRLHGLRQLAGGFRSLEPPGQGVGQARVQRGGQRGDAQGGGGGVCARADAALHGGINAALHQLFAQGLAAGEHMNFGGERGIREYPGNWRGF